MATTTLGAMAAGGIYDHLGGGFARYSTDATWTVPHFEKMLYDQAGLVRAYLHAWQVTGEPDWLQVVEETIGYVLTELATPGGGLCSAEDADSEGEEGRFYVWTPDRDRRRARPRAQRRSPPPGTGSPRPGNFEGRTILRRPLGVALARPPDVEEARRALAGGPGAARPPRARRQGPHRVERHVRLGTRRSGRRHRAPGLGGRGRADRRVPPRRAALDRRPAAGCGRGKKGGPDILPTPATTPGSSTCSPGWPSSPGAPGGSDHARDTATAMLELFAGDGDLLYTTGNDAEALVIRPMEILDGAVPAANGVAADALLRLGALIADEELTRGGRVLLDALAAVAAQHPLACANAVAACALCGRGHHRGRGHRRAPRPPRRGPRPVRADHGPRLGRAHRRRRCGTGRARRQPRYVCRRHRLPERPAATPTSSPGGSTTSSPPDGPPWPRRADDDPHRARRLGAKRRRAARHGARRRRKRTPARPGPRARTGAWCSPARRRHRPPSTSTAVRSSGCGSRWGEEREPDLSPLEIVDVVWADDPERDDLAQPEAVTVTGVPSVLGTVKGRRARRVLRDVALPPQQNLLGFAGSSAPYWEFRGMRPSVAVVVPSRGPGDLPPTRGRHGVGPLRLAPQRQLAALGGPPGRRRAGRVAPRPAVGKGPRSRPRLPAPLPRGGAQPPADGHCYKTVAALLPRP